ncbi:MAG: hypothetical protein AB1393_13805 [Candidatus Edwardsbacteria bacterium]
MIFLTTPGIRTKYEETEILLVFQCFFRQHTKNPENDLFIFELENERIWIKTDKSPDKETATMLLPEEGQR